MINETNEKVKIFELGDAWGARGSPGLEASPAGLPSCCSEMRIQEDNPEPSWDSGATWGLLEPFLAQNQH
jgi:hypothetical protein